MISRLRWRPEHIFLDHISENIANNVFLWNVLQLTFYKFVAQILKVALALSAITSISNILMILLKIVIFI